MGIVKLTANNTAFVQQNFQDLSENRKQYRRQKHFSATCSSGLTPHTTLSQYQNTEYSTGRNPANLGLTSTQTARYHCHTPPHGFGGEATFARLDLPLIIFKY